MPGNSIIEDLSVLAKGYRGVECTVLKEGRFIVIYYINLIRLSTFDDLSRDAISIVTMLSPP